MLVPMTAETAMQISGWTYANEYAVYSFARSDETLRELLCGEYYACLNKSGELIGYVCFGTSARIPTAEEYSYTPDALDMGLGMRPDLCGQGLGYAFIMEAIAFARRELAAGDLRLSVFAGNRRAVRVYTKAGFHYEASVNHRLARTLFYIMRCPSRQRRKS